MTCSTWHVTELKLPSQRVRHQHPRSLPPSTHPGGIVRQCSAFQRPGLSPRGTGTHKSQRVSFNVPSRLKAGWALQPRPGLLRPPSAEGKAGRSGSQWQSLATAQLKTTTASVWRCRARAGVSSWSQARTERPSKTAKVLQYQELGGQDRTF